MPKYNCHTSSLLSVLKSILISKIDYGLPFYGRSPKSTLRKIRSILNAAVRTTLGAYRTTPINNMLLEANIPSLENKRDYLTMKLIKSIINCNNPSLLKFIQKYNTQNPKKKNTCSTLFQCINLCKLNEIYTPPQIKVIPTTAPWFPINNLVNISLSKFNKAHTLPSYYVHEFHNIQNDHPNVTFLYTDASNLSSIYTYAITTESSTLKTGILPFYSTIFSTEIIAIYQAINLIKDNYGKFIICSDSLSALQAISNPNNNDFYPSAIRNLLIKLKAKISLLWIPGHSNILGNELTDHTAKNTAAMPLITTPNFNHKDSFKHAKTSLYKTHSNTLQFTSDWYRLTNPLHPNTFISYLPLSNLSRNLQTKVLRIRLGHTKLTNQHYINPSLPHQ